jgi:hypothetical protein
MPEALRFTRQGRRSAHVALRAAHRIMLAPDSARCLGVSKPTYRLDDRTLAIGTGRAEHGPIWESSWRRFAIPPVKRRARPMRGRATPRGGRRRCGLHGSD